MAFEYELSAREKARLDLISDKLIADAAADGITATRDQIEDLPSVRLFVLSDHDAGGAMAELRRLPAIAGQVRQNEVARQLNTADSAIQKDIAKLNPTQRLTLGHEIDAARKAADAARAPVQMSAEEEAMKILALRQISHPATRLAMAREWGLA